MGVVALSPFPKPLAAVAETEDGFQDAVIALAKLHGWMVAHFRPARTGQGWRTPVAADGVGFPDLVLVRERVIFAELKARRGRVSEDQQRWIDALSVAGAEAVIWRPRDWETIVDVLRRPA